MQCPNCKEYSIFNQTTPCPLCGYKTGEPITGKKSILFDEPYTITKSDMIEFHKAVRAIDTIKTCALTITWMIVIPILFYVLGQFLGSGFLNRPLN
jgi:hypothetical protein